jgi:hypothetical protein
MFGHFNDSQGWQQKLCVTCNENVHGKMIAGRQSENMLIKMPNSVKINGLELQ